LCGEFLLQLLCYITQTKPTPELLKIYVAQAKVALVIKLHRSKNNRTGSENNSNEMVRVFEQINESVV